MLEMTPFMLKNTSMVKPTEVLQELKLSIRNTLYIKSSFSNVSFCKKKIEGREDYKTATVLKYKENSILMYNRLLDYSY